MNISFSLLKLQQKLISQTHHFLCFVKTFQIDLSPNGVKYPKDVGFHLNFLMVYMAFNYDSTCRRNEFPKKSPP